MVFSAALADLLMVFCSFISFKMYFDLQLLFMKCLNLPASSTVRKGVCWKRWRSGIFSTQYLLEYWKCEYCWHPHLPCFMKLSLLSDFFFLCDPLPHPLPIPPPLCNILKSAKLFALFSISIATIYIGRDPFLKQTLIKFLKQCSLFP